MEDKNYIPTLPIIEHFLKLSNLYFNRNEITRGGAFKRSSDLLKDNYPKFLPENILDLQKIKGFGGSSYKEVLDFLDNPNTERLINLLNENDDKQEENNSINKLKKLLGNK